ncbi:hypothetical protein CLU79DRAFT_762258 [Phycomyces nitens]|nr:hypothetical protein CLU79DRAFT_762258 [Phycomyces nitens]
MSLTSYETHTFKLDETNNLQSLEEAQSKEIVNEENDDQTLPVVKTGRRNEWDDPTVKVLLGLMIENGFYDKYTKLDNTGKSILWKALHKDFCNRPEVSIFAATHAGKMFSQKYQNIKYVKEKFQAIKKDFRKVVADISKTDSSNSLQSSYRYFDEMKEITKNDPAVWGSENTESIILPDLVARTSRENEASHDTPSLYAPLHPSTTLENTTNSLASISPSPAENTPSVSTLTPASASLPKIASPLARDDGRNIVSKSQNELSDNARRLKVMQSNYDSIEDGLRRIKEFYVRSIENHRIDFAAAEEARRLDRITREKIAEREFVLREKEMLSRERIAELKILSRERIAEREFALREKELRIKEKLAEQKKDIWFSWNMFISLFNQDFGIIFLKLMQM